MECHWEYYQENLQEILLFPSKNGSLGSLYHRHPHLHGLAHHTSGKACQEGLLAHLKLSRSGAQEHIEVLLALISFASSFLSPMLNAAGVSPSQDWVCSQ